MNFSYEVSRKRLIYVFGLPYETHRGLLKIGETTFTGNLDADARRRIDNYTRTAGIDYELLHTELAVDKFGNSFSDYDVHRVLKNFRAKINGTTAQEWFRVDLETAKRAIRANFSRQKIYLCKC